MSWRISGGDIRYLVDTQAEIYQILYPIEQKWLVGHHELNSR